jgi:hypothetical protein
MSDIFEVETYSDQNSSSGATAGSRYGEGLDTGDLRRKFNFGDRVSELSLAQDPFFRFVSKVAKKPTDDPSFKFTEKRPSWMKRYAYAVAMHTSGAAEVHNAEIDDTNTGSAVAVGGTVKVYMATDYLSQGNLQNVYGSTSGTVEIGATGTRPEFLIDGQLIKLPVRAVGSDSHATTGYHVIKITDVITSDLSGNAGVDNDNMECKLVTGTVVKKASDNELASFILDTGFSTGASGGSNVANGEGIASKLENLRSYVIGSAFAEGSGYPETWKDQPYSTGQGQTQIWKTSCAMTNTARATALKYESNEWARVWKEKLIEHKYDIEQSLLFGSQYTDATGINYTQGAVDWITTYGNAFSLAIASKTADSFLDDMSNLMDPRYNDSKATVFFCSTEVYNWLHKLGGYFQNNLEISSNFRADLAVTGRKKVLGLDSTTIATVYGDMNVVRNIHLDGTNIAMLGVNMKHCAYRPLSGNGLNRDTSVYVGVQTLENSGVDRRVDMILTEAGMQWEMPEAHAVWTK